MEEFVREQNIERYCRLLGENPTEAERKVLERLLAEEEAKGHEKSEEEGRQDGRQKQRIAALRLIEALPPLCLWKTDQYQTLRNTSRVQQLGFAPMSLFLIGVGVQGNT